MAQAAPELRPARGYVTGPQMHGHLVYTSIQIDDDIDSRDENLGCDEDDD